MVCVSLTVFFDCFLLWEYDGLSPIGTVARCPVFPVRSRSARERGARSQAGCASFHELVAYLVMYVQAI